jgi:hypothetical protein
LAVPHVGEIFSIERHEQNHVVELWAHVAIDGHSRRKARYFIAKSGEKLGEESVALVAEAAASTTDDLVVDLTRVQGNLPTAMDIQVLEGHGFQERVLQRPQSFRSWFA